MADITLSPLEPREALAFFRSKGFAPALQRFDYRDFWREEHARGFVVAKAMRDDVLLEIRDALELVLEEGQTLAQFRKDLAPKLRAMGWWGKGIERDPLTGELKEVELGSMRRLKVIFDTNMRTSYAAGQWARLQRTKDFLPYLEYRQLQRETKREEHEPFHGLILPIDHPIWRIIFPPNGWFCACSVRPMNDRMLKREGKRLTTPKELDQLESEAWTNPRSGETNAIPKGLDPAFASNPGFAWQDIDARHRDTSLSLPDTHRSSDRGFTKELAALALRDQRAALLAYDLNDDPEASPIGMTRGAPGKPELAPAPMTPDIAVRVSDAGTQVVLMRSDPAGIILNVSDLQLFAPGTGLRQLLLVAPDGSVHRAARGEVSLPAGFDAAPLFSEAAQAMRRALPDANADLINEMASHAVLRLLAERGMLRYADASSGRLQRWIDQAGSAIEQFIGAVLFGQ